MTREEILQTFGDINHAYNDCTKYDTLKRMLDELTEPCDCINRVELLKAVDTCDKFGCDADSKLVPYKDCYVPYIHYDDVVKAIKGMPSVQPKITGYEDCINRQAVNDLIDELARAISDERCCMSRGRSTATIMQEILDLLSVQPKMGYWSPIKSMGGTTIAIRCSCCGNSPKYRVRSDFCPNCGGKDGGLK